MTVCTVTINNNHNVCHVLLKLLMHEVATRNADIPVKFGIGTI